MSFARAWKYFEGDLFMDGSAVGRETSGFRPWVRLAQIPINALQVVVRDVLEARELLNHLLLDAHVELACRRWYVGEGCVSVSRSR